MNVALIMKRVTNIASWSMLIFSFLLFYSDTHQFTKSLFAAFMTFGLVWISFVAISWIVQSIFK